MNPSPDWLNLHNNLFGAAGIIGLAVLALAAARMARDTHGWGPRLIAAGAVVLLLARVYLMASPLLLPPPVLVRFGHSAVTLSLVLPPFMLTIGLFAVVWGFWGHSRELARLR
jgi:hypothetical protein